MAKKSLAFNAAPPINPPSTSGFCKDFGGVVWFAGASV